MSTDDATLEQDATAIAPPDERSIATGRPVPDEALERRTLERLWLTVTMLLIAFGVFAQSSGNASADTKLDLVVSPLRLLGRALHLWDPTINGGQLQNQAYGYLFPIGPFYAVTHALGVAPWEMQRGFESLILCLAFLGTYRLARRLGIDSFWPALGAGLAYALSPRALSELTSISAELMPFAALPWVVLPLVDGAAGGSPRRAAGRSGVALLFAGGVNAAATVAILPVPLLWLITRTGGPRRRALLGWWAVAVALACAWWAVPLLLLGKYSPPFLDWVESSSVTTAPTSILAVLRGTDHWEGYLGPGVWPGGWILVTGGAAIVATTAVAAIGIAGIARRRVPHALFLWSCLLLGAVVVTLGHSASIGPPAAASWRELLDGPLVPFRNIHKFDPLLRLPIAVGVGHVLAAAGTLRDREVGLWRVSWRLPARALACALVAAVGAVAIAPMWTNHLVSKQRITPEASWWAATGAWLARHSEGARALVVPGSASPAYVWGSTVDDALQPVATTPWTVRGAVPLTQPGYIRLLDSIESTLAAGAGAPDLAPLLARAGIGFVVVANDLDTLSSQSTPLLYVHATLANSPGVHLRAGFGVKVGGSLSPTVSIDAGGSVARPAVQVYSVDGWPGRASLDPLEDAVAAAGSSDALPQLVGRGLGTAQPVLFGRDGAGLPLAVRVTTDGIRRREASFAGSLTPSATMTSSQPYSQNRPQHDYLPNDPGPLSAFRYAGIADVTASSSGADGFAFLNRGDRNGPWSALDADPSSSWQSTGLGAVGQWLDVRFSRPLRPSGPARITLGTVDDGPAKLPTQVLVTTDAGTTSQAVLPLAGAPQELRLPTTPITHLRITIAAVAGGGAGASVAIASLTVPGIAPVRTLVVPSDPRSDVFAFDAAAGYRSECLELSVGTTCDPLYGRQGQEDSGIDRTFTTRGGDFVPEATVRLAGGPALDAMLDAGNPVQATASSVYSTDPRQRAGAAVDGDAATVWEAAPGDIKPVLSLALSRPRLISAVTITTPATAPVAAPLAVTIDVSGPDGTVHWHADLPADGRVLLPRAVRAARMAVRIDRATIRTSVSTVGGRSRLLPVGVGDIRIDGADPVRVTGRIRLSCLQAPSLAVDDTTVTMQIDADRADVLAGRPVRATACSDLPVHLDAGQHRVALVAGPPWSPVSITLTRSGIGLARDAPAGNLRISRWDATERAVRVDSDRAALLVVHENANAGWQATLGGHRLRAVRVDGWEQGFVVPARSHGTAQLRYAPQRGFELGLAGGLAAALALILLATMRPRRSARFVPGRPHDAQPRRVLPAVGVLMAAGLLAGWTGAVAAAAVGIAGLITARSMRPLFSAALCGGVLVVAGLVVARSEPARLFAQQNSGQVQLLCVTGLAIGAFSALWRGRSQRDE